MEIEPVTIESSHFVPSGRPNNPPADRVPSHGTNQLGETHAYDFVRIEKERKGLKFFRGSMLRYILLGVTLDECYRWLSRSLHPFQERPLPRKTCGLKGKGCIFSGTWPSCCALMFDPKRTNDLRPLL